MYEFKYETTGVNKEELIKDIEALLWKMKYTWPVMLCNDINWIKEKTEGSWLKLNGGYQKQILNVINKKEHK